MSDAIGHVIKDNKVVGYFEYVGSGDVPHPIIRTSEKEIDENWRPTGENIMKAFKLQQSCTHKIETLVLWTEYGSRGGMHWQHPVCLECKLIMDFDFDITSISKRGYPIKKVRRS